MKATRETSDSRAVWVVPALLIVLYGVVQAVAFAVLPERDEDGAIVRGGRVPVGEVVVGDCFDWVTDIEAGSIRQVDLQPCEQVHEAQAVAQTMYPAASTAEWPGIEAIDAYGHDRCASALPTGTRLVNLMPTDRSWEDGDRTITCIAVA